MNSFSPEVTVSKPPRRRMVRWLVPLLSLVAIVIMVTAYMGWRMTYVPANLDLSTNHATQNGIFEVAYEPTNNVIPINELHTWTLTVTTPEGRAVDDAQITVDGDMPQHGHGLATQPQVTEYLGDGKYLIEGLKFQMGGWWVMDFTITANEQADNARFNLVLK
jgi:YtkA-like